MFRSSLTPVVGMRAHVLFTLFSLLVIVVSTTYCIVHLFCFAVYLDVLSLKNSMFGYFVDRIYPMGLRIKAIIDTDIDTDRYASQCHKLFSIGNSKYV
jgi:hypothetical protein